MEFSIKNKKSMVRFLLLCIALFFLSGCEMKKMGGDAASKESYVVTDAFDNQVTIPHKPKDPRHGLCYRYDASWRCRTVAAGGVLHCG